MDRVVTSLYSAYDDSCCFVFVPLVVAVFEWE